MWKEHCAETGEALSASGGSGAGLGETDASIRSTQMKILHKNGFTADERRECAGTIRKNTITSIQQLIIGCQELQYMFEKNFEAKAKAVMDISDANSVSSTHIDYIEDLWKVVKRARTQDFAAALPDVANQRLRDFLRIQRPSKRL